MSKPTTNTNTATQLEKRMKQLRIIPGIIPEEALRHLFKGKAVMLVVGTKERYFVGIYSKPHPLERMFE